MNEIMGWAFLVGGGVAIYNGNQDNGKWFILLAQTCFIVSEIRKVGSKLDRNNTP